MNKPITTNRNRPDGTAKNSVVTLILFISFAIASCTTDYQPPDPIIPTRDVKIPGDVIKMTPETDRHPPILHSEEFEEPVPMPGPVNTAGAEDSPFMANDRNEFYFFFTPDVREPLETQLIDSVTGIYQSEWINERWTEPARVLLQEQGKLALDGCQYVHRDSLWFCSAREGYTGLHWFLARDRAGTWADWTLADFESSYQVGELHFVGNQLFYHSSRSGGLGELDLWMLTKTNGKWQNPENLVGLNSDGNEGWPWVSEDGNEIWFTRTHLGTPGVFRSFKIDGEWQTPELIISQFAGEPTLDDDGNVYFVHHFFIDGEMIEADIYMIKRIL